MGRKAFMIDLGFRCFFIQRASLGNMVESQKTKLNAFFLAKVYM